MPMQSSDLVEGVSKHWDQILTGAAYNSKPGVSTGGYLTWSRWQVKPGQMHAYAELRSGGRCFEALGPDSDRGGLQLQARRFDRRLSHLVALASQARPNACLCRA